MGEWRTKQVGDWGLHPGGDKRSSVPLASVGKVGSMPLYAAAEVTDGETSLILKLRVNESSGEWEAVAIVLRDEGEDSPLTGKLLRTLPIAKLCREATPMLYRHFKHGDLFGTGQIKAIPEVPLDVIEQWPKGDKHLVFQWVTTVYDAALSVGAPPTRTVGEKFGVNQSKAIHLVRKARDAGVLKSSSVTGPRRKKDNGTKETTDR
ncbi:hypothetical protein [Corynebacterium flavescens]|uniref:hypothetical protein n=1 Tax=Corynebacterium flavescens TaxID=28028 RepID=UPI003FD472C0